MIPRGIRNNNPGNIVKSGIDWLGEKESLDETKFETFATPVLGIRALALCLRAYQTKHNRWTIRQICTRWSETDQKAYVDFVSKALGRAADTLIDISDATNLAALTRAIIQMENGQQPYSPAQIMRGVNAALGAHV